MWRVVEFVAALIPTVVVRGHTLVWLRTLWDQVRFIKAFCTSV